MKNISILDEALKESSEYARRGEKLANSSISLLRKASDSIMNQLNLSISSFNKRNIKVDDAIKPLIEQLIQVRNEISVLPDKLTDAVQALSDKTINITLFGRTMAGKSTLMEILTHGNGESIGRGGQRTTRDVREYSYKGMIVTDVPGIAAFSGEEDTKTAFEASKHADLILFLITDDGPQPSEANCLRSVLSLGKPVICIINVIANIDKKDSLKLFERDLTKKMNENRIQAIKQQFLEFGVSYGQEWNRLQFEYVHLKSAFLSQQPEWNDDSALLYKLSRFSILEKLISKEVIYNGCLYKIKSYIDTVAVPISVTADSLMQQYARTSEQYNTILEKRVKLYSWLTKYNENGVKKIHSSIDTLKSKIRKDIPSFSETHYDDSKAGEKWNNKLKRYKIEEQCGELLNELANECVEKLNDFYREITTELKFNDIILSESSIEMPRIVNGRSLWNWSVTLVSGGLGIAAIFGVPVVGWVALGVGVIGSLFSRLFKSKEKKIAEARQKLETQLSTELDKQFSRIENRLKKIFTNDLVQKQVSPTLVLLDNIITLIESMCTTQKNLSNELYDKHEEIIRSLVNEVFIYNNINLEALEIEHVARITGSYIALASHNELSRDYATLLNNTLNETIWRIWSYTDIRYEVLTLIKQMTDIGEEELEVQYSSSQIGRVVIHKNTISPEIINKIKLIQQLTRIYISK